MDVTDSILNSVKKLLGYEPEYVEFDPDIIMHINSAIFTLRQIGIGPKYGFTVTSEDDTYADYLGDWNLEVNAVKMYLYYKTRLGFDTPQNSYLIEQIKDQIRELEWRLNIQVDPEDTFDNRVDDEEY